MKIQSLIWMLSANQRGGDRMDSTRKSELLGWEAQNSMTVFGWQKAVGEYVESSAAISKVYPEERVAAALFQRRIGWSHPIAGTVEEGMEALLKGLLQSSETVLVLVNGPLGRRIADSCERLGAAVILMERSWGDSIDIDEMERELRSVKPTLLAVAHGEWRTGRSQALARIGKVCEELDIRFIADCSATLGRMPIRSEEWRLDAAIGLLGADAAGREGTAIVSYNDRILAKMLHRSREGCSFLQLCNDWRSFKYSPASLEEKHALNEQAIHQWMNDRSRMAQIEAERLHAEALELGMQAMGLQPAVDSGSKLPYAACSAVPNGADGRTISDRLRELRRLRIDLVQSEYNGDYWSVAATGEQADRGRVLELLTALEVELLKEGVRLTRGRAVLAATMRYDKESKQSKMYIGGMRNGETVCNWGS